MNLLPEWAPNLHPLLVHFPIGLLTTAAALDLLGLTYRARPQLRDTATLLYLTGTVAVLATYWSGRAAAQTIHLPGMAHAVVNEHWDWAFRTVSFFVVVTALRLAFLRPWRVSAPPARVLVFVIAGLVGLVLLYETGDRGGRLVFELGVGVARP
jgi:uncharacterized membrane protein